MIDTPSYEGLAQDKKITKNIKDFLMQKMSNIDAVCFVIRSSQAGLTVTQKYIFDNVLGIFGKDIADNILILMTFSDGRKPQALAALKEGKVPYRKYFELNNSGGDLPDDAGMKAFDDFFAEIDFLKSKSLSLTKKVLTLREELEKYVTAIQPTIRAGFTVYDKLQQQLTLVQKYGDMLNANEDFEYKVMENGKLVTKVAEGLKGKYMDANSNKSAAEQIMVATVAELEEVEENLNGCISSLRACLNELNQIALRPNTLSQDDYIDKLIASEEQERNPGFKNRVAALKAMKEKQKNSTKLTKKVLTRREELENYVTALQPTIRAGFTVYDKLRQQITLVQKYGDMLNANEDFEYKVKETYSIHAQEVTKTARGLKQKYLDANSNKSAEEQIMVATVAELAKVEHSLNGCLSSVRACLNELNQIALRPNTLSQDDYIDKLIASEEQERNFGFKTRVDALKEMKGKQEMLSKMSVEDYVTACVKKNETAKKIKRYTDANGNKIIEKTYSDANGNDVIQTTIEGANWWVERKCPNGNQTVSKSMGGKKMSKFGKKGKGGKRKKNIMANFFG